MRDEDFEVFIEEFGEASHSFAVPEDVIDRWRGRLPEQLLTYWKDEGWCSYAEGLLATVNPQEYQDLIATWLKGTVFEALDDYHVFARSAFGKLYACGIRTGASLTISCPVHAIIALANDVKPQSEDSVNGSVSAFFGAAMQSSFDIEDEDGEPMFRRAVEKFGPLDADEIFSFEPAIVFGGKMALENLQKVKLHQHLMILRQLAPPKVPFSDVDIDRLMP
ncbi:DUF1851 domain-containing protein [Rhizobiaceae bacterium BDR2-2]|uniref:DUF1851 domain-containing protein n=1 Tax=Ectorhizobium quercum TaxID=2965071 RepID=A0AAE3SXL5_9HYPH|nr:GAD-like domain-containing protein [Ectorhizobium quercum]MCX8999908.1 DUF1851 domain-containing protein [Ectorhizobium quercum]